MTLNDISHQLSQTLSVKSESMPAASSYLANGSITLFGWFTLNEWLALLGTVLGLATFVLNMRHQRRREARDRRREERERELHGVQMQGKQTSSEQPEK